MRVGEHAAIEVVNEAVEQDVTRVPGTAVYLCKDPAAAPAAVSARRQDGSSVDLHFFRSGSLGGFDSLDVDLSPAATSAGVSAGGSKDRSDTGCVSEVWSPAAGPCGAGRSWTLVTGLPSRRSSTNSSPCLVGCTSAGTVSPRTRRSTRLGCAGTS